MTKYREILRLNSLKISQRQIALSCGCSRNTVAKVLLKASEMAISWPLKDDPTDGEIRKLLFPKDAASTSSLRKPPDLEYIHKEMAKHGVTLKLLWTEYCEECRLQQTMPFMYSQFCKQYQDYAQHKRASMHIPRKPGEQIEVDWAGKTASIYHRDSKKPLPAWLFVGVLSFSQYAFVEAFPNRDTESWITAHVHMFTYFSGVTRIIIPDNLRTGVSKTDRYSPTINRAYQEMAEFYNTAIVPARIRKPKDKPNVEGTVSLVSQQILAALRNRPFFSFTELNRAIREKLEELNDRPFQKKMGSRRSTFLGQEKSLLMPIPAAPFELATWKQATVQFNYHISVEKNQYSVPYEYIKHKVDVRITRNIIEVFYNHIRICSHPRITGHIGHFSTVESHMPPNHQK
ncbi:IS21 family transposase [Spirochaeta dissipatitropha]